MNFYGKTINEEAFKGYIKWWYIANYPTDDLGKSLDRDATFEGLFFTLANGEDVYRYIGVGDSVIRERLFEKLADITGFDYDYIYDLWMSDGLKMVE